MNRSLERSAEGSGPIAGPVSGHEEAQMLENVLFVLTLRERFAIKTRRR